MIWLLRIGILCLKHFLVFLLNRWQKRLRDILHFWSCLVSFLRSEHFMIKKALIVATLGVWDVLDPRNSFIFSHDMTSVPNV